MILPLEKTSHFSSTYQHTGQKDSKYPPWEHGKPRVGHEGTDVQPAAALSPSAPRPEQSDLVSSPLAVRGPVRWQRPCGQVYRRQPGIPAAARLHIHFAPFPQIEVN